MKDCPKDLGKTARKVGVNLKEGLVKKGGHSSQSEVVGYTTGHPGQCSLIIKVSWKAPFPNPDPFMCWSGTENIAWIKIGDEGSWALLDSDSTINTVTLEFRKACSLVVGTLSNLVDGTLKINGFEGLFYVDGTLKINWFGDCFPNPQTMSS